MGTYLSRPKTEKVSEDGENHRVRYGLSSMQGWRTSMEDAHAALPDLDSSTSFFAVYDGHGGKAVAKFCAKFLHKELLTDEAYMAGDFAKALRRAFLRMDEVMRTNKKWRELIWGDIEKTDGVDDELFLMSGKNEDETYTVSNEDPDSDSEEPTSGCTACAVLVRDDKLLIANAGDSRCVMSKGGQAYDLSKDHKPEIEAEKERILKAGGFIHGGRINGSLNLTRAIGDMEFKRNNILPAEEQIVTANPDVNTVDLSEDTDFIVLACDGIWDCMSSQELVDFVHEQLKLQTKLSIICERVLDNCLATSVGGEGCDNMTIILIQLKKSATSSSSIETGYPLSAKLH
ncbi:hypothetical protein SOVF_144130 [Spinacia oleracea]|nr:probable protein phosphatase 2C 21 isoform X2 [Spinacia oleracea]KNA10479.1 hypothetical protein SOVF_144130 [Spinacia oleracea]